MLGRQVDFNVRDVGGSRINLSDGRYCAFLHFWDGAARVQGVDIAFAEPELLKNLFVVFSKRRGALCRDFCNTMNLNGTADR